MKKNFVIAGILVLTLVLFLSGCTENNSNKGGNTNAKTLTMTAKEVTDDMTMDSDWTSYIKILYKSLSDGDTLIIKDSIDNITYDSTSDRTTVKFDTSTDGNATTSLSYPFEGDITGTYSEGDEVKITGTIKYVKETYTKGEQSMEYEIEIFSEMWTNMDDYIATQGGALPSSSITKA